MKDARVTVRFPEGMKKQLEEIAANRGWNVSQLIREIIREYLMNKQNQ